MATVAASLYNLGLYGVGLYGAGYSIQLYPSLFTDKGYNRRPRRDLYYPPTKIR